MAVQFQFSCEGIDGILDRLGKCFNWLGMYCGKLKYTIEHLEKSRNELEYMTKMVENTMNDAEHNGRKPIEMARCWVHQGKDWISRANGVVEVYNKRADEPTSTIISIIFCPCETMSRRTLNCEAIMRMNQIFEHKEDGKKYATGAFDAVSYTGPSSVPPVLHGSSNSPPNKPFTPTDMEHMQLDGFAKYHAFARYESLDCVPVVIRVNAPAYIRGSRAPVDLVMVLDISGGMRVDGKLDQVKQGSIFVIHNLEEKDRLCIVTFGKQKKVLLPLTSMSDEGKRLANRKVRSLKAVVGISTVGQAMDLVYKTLRERRHKTSVTTILLLTGGGQDDKRIFKESLRYTEKSSLNQGDYPTYTFGFGLDHDPRTLYNLATGGCGTYSFVTEDRSIRDAMALCIGGLTSIVAQKVEISIDSAHQGVKISGMMCGGYNHYVAPGGESGFISLKDLYASEEKNFIVYVNVPAADEAAGGFARTAVTKLLTVRATYYCPLSRANVHTDAVEISVERPGRIWDRDRDISVEVASEITRTNIFNGVNDIWRRSSSFTQYNMNVRTAGEYLKRQLNDLRDFIDGTEEAKAAKERWDDLRSDLHGMMDDMSEIFDMINFSKDSGIDVSSQVTGLPYMLSWLSSHQWQRAATPGAISQSSWFNFRTTRMQNMIESVESAPSAYTE